MKTNFKLILQGTKTKLQLICFLSVAIGSGFLVVFANDMLAVVMNNYLMVQNLEGLARRLLLTAGVFILVCGMQTFGDYLSTVFEFETISRLMRHYIAKLLRTKYEFFLNRPAAETYTGLWTAVEGTGFFFGNLLRLISSVVIFVFYGIVVFRLDILAGVFTVLALPVCFLLTAGFGEKIVAANSEYLKRISELSAVTQEGFENVANVKAKGTHDFFTSRSVYVLRKIKSAVVQEVTISNYIGNITRLLRIVAPLLIILAVMRFSSAFEASAGTIMVLYINIPLFLAGFGSFIEHYFEWMATKPSLAKLKEFDNAQPEETSGIDISTFENLRVENVKVSFGDERVIAVPDFEVKQGEKVMFFGESGIGKSTFFNIVMGFQQYEGTILVNGINLREIKLSSLRRVFGITFQHTNALALSLHENILLGAEKDAAELDKIIQLASLETQQTDKGESVLNNKVLSGGEKSRLGISQMLALEPSVMLIDEAFSNMDEQLESKIIGDLFREYPNRAVICISHRNSSRPFFDRVVEFTTA